MYEFDNIKSTDVESFYGESCFTDDVVMTLIVVMWLIEDDIHSEHHLVKCMQELGRCYLDAGCGDTFPKEENTVN